MTRQLPEIRCSDCIAIECECPQGYYSGHARCAVCTHEIVLVVPMCVEPGGVECPACGRMSMTRDDDEG